MSAAMYVYIHICICMCGGRLRMLRMLRMRIDTLPARSSTQRSRRMREYVTACLTQASRHNFLFGSGTRWGGGGGLVCLSDVSRHVGFFFWGWYNGHKVEYSGKHNICHNWHAIFVLICFCARHGIFETSIFFYLCLVILA